ncbi:hypothetical protein [Frigoribacterium salinisoli]
MNETRTPTTLRTAPAGATRDTVLPGSPREVRGQAPGGLRRLVAGLLLALVLASPAVPASAAPSPPAPAPSLGAPTPSPTPTPTPTPTPPTVDPPGDQRTGTVRLRGTAAPGSRVHVLGPAGTDACTAATTPLGTWSCVATLGTVSRGTVTVQDVTHPRLLPVTSAPFSVLVPPTVEGGALVLGRLGGTAEAGATVTVAAPGRPTVTARAAADGRWTTLLPARGWPTGTVVATATQSTPAVPDVPVSGEATATVVLDRDAPAAPVLTAPAAGTSVGRQPVTFEGTGEESATVTVYVDGSAVCQSPVLGGTWRCSSEGAPLLVGTRSVQAAQIDAAGNQGPPGAGVTLRVGAAPPGGAATPPGTPTEPSGPGASAPPATTPPGGAPGAPGDGTDDGAGDGTDDAGAGAGSGPPGGTGPGSSGGGEPDGTGTSADSGWTVATGFGDQLPSPSQATTGPTWLLAAALALAFLLVAVLPARLAAAAVRGRRAVHARLTGRNRAREVPTSFNEKGLDPRVATVLTVLAGAAVIALAAGVDGQLRYARLFGGIALGLLVVNSVCLVLPAVAVARLRGRRSLRTVVRVSPRLLLAAAVAAGATRLLSLDPPFVLGALVTAAVVLRPVDGTVPADERADVRTRGLAALAQLAALVLVPIGAWALHGVVGTSPGFGPQLLRETLATVCLAGLGSLVLGLLPVGAAPGRALWAWHRPAHLATALVGVTAAAVVFVGNPAAAFPVVPVVVAAALVTVVAVAAWLWVRFVEPVTATP